MGGHSSYVDSVAGRGSSEAAAEGASKVVETAHESHTSLLPVFSREAAAGPDVEAAEVVVCS
jgi:hypothetical protein